MSKIIDSLLDKTGWKKDVNRILIGLIIVFSIWFVYACYHYLLSSDTKVFELGGQRIFFDWQKINYETYRNDDPEKTFSFHFPQYYVLDKDPNKQYGSNYLAGFHLETDSRTGCEVRLNPIGINFSKTDEEIKNVLSRDIARTAKDFQLESYGRIKIQGSDGFMVTFSFLNPIGQRVRLTQVLASSKNANYLLVCGTGDYQYKYFRHDFDNFFDTFGWE